MRFPLSTALIVTTLALLTGASALADGVYKVDSQLLPIPINLDTVNRLYNLSLTSDEVEDFFAANAEKVDEIRTSEDVVVSRVGRDRSARSGS